MADETKVAAPGVVGAAELIAAARAKVAGKPKGTQTVQLAFEGEDAALFAKIEADAKADDRPVSKFLLRWVRQNYKMA